MFDNTKMIVNVCCRSCNDLHEVTVTVDGFRTWQDRDNGVLIQDAMPELSPNDREMLISQTCSTCWDKMFPEEDE